MTNIDLRNTTTGPSSTTLLASVAAAMLMTGTASAAEEPYAPDAGSGDILVIGRGEKVDLATMRGPIIDIPQTINIISPETLKDRQITTLGEALRNVAGVTTSVGEGGVVNGDQFFIRGQSARDDIFTDGLRDFGAFTRDAFNYESVQVLKGSSSTALGRGVSGGAINTQSKRAEAQDHYSATLGAGTDDYYRVTVDANKAISDTAGFRINGMFHRNDTPDRDNVFSHRWGIAPAFSFGKGMDTNFDLIFFHQEEDKTVDYGVPIAVTTANDIERPVTEFGVPRSNFYGFDGDEDNTVVNTVTARFGHKVNDWLSLTSDTKVGVYKRHFRQTVPGCAAATCGDFLTDGNPATVPTMAAGVRGQFRQTTRGIQNVSTALVEKSLGGMRNELIIGWDISYQTNDREDDIRPGNGAVSSVNRSLFAPGGADPIFTRKVYQYRDSSATDYSFFIDERLWLTPKLSINAGVRYQRFTADQDQTALTTNANAPVTSCNGATVTGTCFSRSSSKNNLWNPKASVIWEPSDKMSFYTSYSKAAVPPGNSVSNGSLATPTGAITANDLKPEETETFDLGAKFSLFGDHLLIQSAIYQINRANAKDLDPNTQLLVASSEPKQRLRGFELGVSGAINPELLITANYTYVDAEIREAFSSGAIDTAAIGKQVRYVPKHAASFWTSYKPVDGSLKGLEIGAGANYQSKVFVNNLNTQVTPSYVSFDALLGYSFGKYRVAVNGYNLGDELYYAQVNGGRVVPAAGRSVVVTLGASF